MATFWLPAPHATNYTGGTRVQPLALFVSSNIININSSKSYKYEQFFDSECIYFIKLNNLERFTRMCIYWRRSFTKRQIRLFLYEYSYDSDDKLQLHFRNVKQHRESTNWLSFARLRSPRGVPLNAQRQLHTTLVWVIDWMFEGHPTPLPLTPPHSRTLSVLTLYITDSFVLSKFPLRIRRSVRFYLY